MVEIKAGPELDRAVAEAIGLVSTHRVLGSDIEFWSDPRAPREAPRTFHPSMDLNDAFYAGEAVGLFTSVRSIRPNRYHWEVIEDGDPLERIISKGDTPALAICAAILELAKLGEAS